MCSVGLDMIAIPGDTPEPVICGIIADEIAIGGQTTRRQRCGLSPPEAKTGDTVEFGGLWAAPVMKVSEYGCERFIRRGG